MINNIGLVLDILGIFLLFKFRIPEKIDRSEAVYLVTEETDEVQNEKIEGWLVDCDYKLSQIQWMFGDLKIEIE